MSGWKILPKRYVKSYLKGSSTVLVASFVGKISYEITFSTSISKKQNFLPVELVFDDMLMKICECP